MTWLEEQLATCRSSEIRPLVFTHLYPSELANDGHTIYATTRSTGQIEEGPQGFSITVIEDDVVSWKFRERGPWPFAMVTSPADERLITKPQSSSHIVRGVISICARAWDRIPIRSVRFSIEDGPERIMHFAGDRWECVWDSSQVPDGLHRIRIRVQNVDLREAEDAISVLVSQSGQYTPATRHPIDYKNAIGPYPEKGILGTQLGPNRNGTKGPWPSWRSRQA
jgi:3',5'-cyclic-AMP phosphodiesterase